MAALPPMYFDIRTYKLLVSIYKNEEKMKQTHLAPR
jgi:hypothetical protein